MKKNLTAILLAVCTASAHGQTTIAVYGLVDVGLTHESGGMAGGVTKLTSGVDAGSRLGIKGQEALGGGLAALFLLETGFQADTGALGQGGLLFGRQAWVGLQGRYGTVTAGRQYTPQYLSVVLADPFASGGAGDTKNLMAPTGNAASRMDNTLKYVSPTVAGWRAELAYGAGEGSDGSAAGRQAGAALDYGAGPLRIRIGHHNRDNDTASAKGMGRAANTVVAAVYDFGFAKAYCAYGVAKGTNSSLLRNNANPYGLAVVPVPSRDSRDLLLGTSVPIGAHTLMASYIHKDDRSVPDRDASQFALGYRYALSKRSLLYASAAHIANRHGAGYTVGSAIEGGSGNRAIDLGIQHAF